MKQKIPQENYTFIQFPLLSSSFQQIFHESHFQNLHYLPTVNKISLKLLLFFHFIAAYIGIKDSSLVYLRELYCIHSRKGTDKETQSILWKIRMYHTKLRKHNQEYKNGFDLKKKGKIKEKGKDF